MPKSTIILTLLLFSPIAYTLPTSERLGTFYSSDRGYLKLASYISLNSLGPYQIAPRLKPPASFYKLSKAQKICFNIKDLKEFLPKDLPPKEATDYLPTTEKTFVVPDSVTEPDQETTCYLLKKGIEQITQHDFNNALKESQSLFSSFHGLEKIPEEKRDELTNVWNKRKTTEKKIRHLSKYWQKKIKYAPDSLGLLLNYVNENSDQDLLQAMFKYKFSDCGPKNFALGLSIWELSNHTIPVRLNYALWLIPTSKDETTLTTDRLHIHVEYLIRDKKGEYRWKTAESAFDTNVYRKIYNR